MSLKVDLFQVIKSQMFRCDLIADRFFEECFEMFGTIQKPRQLPPYAGTHLLLSLLITDICSDTLAPLPPHYRHNYVSLLLSLVISALKCCAQCWK